MRLLPLIATMAAACGTTATDPTTPTDSDDTSLACGADEAVVSFRTSDDVKLAADYWPAASAGAPLVVLLHMTPVAWDRTSWPQRFRKTLHDDGYAVLNVDRRGAGDSEGTPEDAFVGPGGRLDVEAAVAWATDPARGCAVDASRLAIVGASNGTTSALDYTVAASVGLPKPAAVVFMSPGTYTENQHRFGDDWDLSFPILWLHPTNEPYSLDFVADAPGAWEFVERGGQHGTLMLDGGDLEDQTTADITRVLAAALAD